ncbi:MAG: FAD-binding oxidoreductase [Candidatus Omnitrophota bacterium]
MPKELELQIKEVIERTYNVKSFRFAVSEEIDFKPGQFLQAFVKENGKELNHYFSISNSPTEKGFIEFTKKLTESEYSKILDKLKPADSLKIKYPFGAFTFVGEYPKIAFLSGGIGITPIRSIIKFVVDKKIGTDIVLIYANRTTKDIAFKEDFAIMQKDYPNLKVVHILSEAGSEWHGRTGRINSQVIKEEIPDYNQRRFYICGPPLMVEAMKKILTDDLVLSQDKIVTENFAGY